MAAAFVVLLEEEIYRLENIPRRVLKDRQDPFSMNDSAFIRSFRADKDIVLMVTERIKRLLPEEGLPPHIRVLSALRFYATGSYQLLVADDLHLALSQSTVSRCIDSVSRAMTMSMLQSQVKFPSPQEIVDVKRRFYEKYGFPGIMGCIDCTHIAIVQPTSDSTDRPLGYINRKGFFSINVQLICDDALMIRGVSARYPGSVHDSFIWHYSDIRSYIMRQYESGNTNSWLLGDSGYPLEPWLMTPFPDPPTSQNAELFNSVHVSVRNVVERCNGVLKSRFRCLLKHRVLHYNPTKASLIINACVVLHNLCTEKNLPYDEYEEDEDDIESENDGADNMPRNLTSNTLRATAQRLREQIALCL